LAALTNAEASVGIASYPEDATTRDTLLRTADGVMYAAKFAKKAQQKVEADARDTELRPASHK
jgi:predicted signal transduction protein with EAL and GGDEF domain